MLISEFMQEYSLYNSLITAWNRAGSNRLVLEVDLSNLNQTYYTEDMEDFRKIILIFEGCTLVDELNEGFNGFSSGDTAILEATEVKESTSPMARQGIKLAMDYDNYDGADERLIVITIFADEVSVIDADRKFHSSKTGDDVESHKEKPTNPGWREKDHWHRYNSNATGKHDAMLDKKGNPVPKYSKASYIEPGK